MMRGRPRKTDPDAVLNTAMKVFWKRGYDGTSMNDLATATGMAKPGLYATFGDKETLYSKALSYYFNELGSPILDDVAQSPDSLTVVVRRFLDAIAASVTNKSTPKGCFVVNNVVECSGGPPSLEILGRSFDDKRRAVFIKRFRDAKKQGQLPDDADAKSLAEFFAGQSLALAVMGRAGTNQKALNRFIATAMTVLPNN